MLVSPGGALRDLADQQPASARRRHNRHSAPGSLAATGERLTSSTSLGCSGPGTTVRSRGPALIGPACLWRARSWRFLAGPRLPLFGRQLADGRAGPQRVLVALALALRPSPLAHRQDALEYRSGVRG